MSPYESVDGLDIELVEGVLTLRLARPDKRNALDAPLVEALIDAHVAGEADHGRRLWALLALEHWARSEVGATPGRSPDAGAATASAPSPPK